MEILEYIGMMVQTTYKKWFAGVYEYSINWGSGYRIYLMDLIMLLGGGSKKRQGKNINQAKELHKEYRARKKRAES